MAGVATVSRLARALPGVEEGTSYGTPAWRVRRRFLGRIHDDGRHLVLKVDPAERAALLAAEPEVFSLTPHYEGSAGLVLVDLAAVPEDELAELLEEAWRREASARAVAAWDARGG